jgi:hypothetical protein
MISGRWLNVGVAALLHVAVSGCSFDTTAAGGSGALGGTEADSGSTTAAPGTSTSPTSNATEGGNESGPGDSTTGSEGDEATTGSSGEPASVAILELSQSFDFELVDQGGSDTHVFRLENVGEASATGVMPTVGPLPFAIANTDCESDVPPRGSCEIEVVFAPTSIGAFGGELVVAYHDGQAAQAVARDIAGGGAGQTGNLIRNPGGENCNGDAPPNNWFEVVGDDWQCSTGFGGVVPHPGDAMFFPGLTADGTVPDLAQDVPVPEELLPLVSQGAISIRFSGWSVSVSNGDDPRRFQLEFIDAARRPIAGATWESRWNAGDAWTQVEDVMMPDAATTAIRVHLQCSIMVPTNCSAMFDDLRLHFVYP